MEEVVQAGSDLAYSNQTMIAWPALFALALAVCFTLSLRRSLFWVPTVVLTAVVPFSQRIALGGLDFTLFRILVIIAAVRALSLRWYTLPSASKLDKCVYVWLAVSGLVYALREASVSAVVYKAGFFLDSAFCFMMFRAAFSERTDVERALRVLCILAVIISVAFLLEVSSGRNVFSYFGGVPEFTKVRDGRLRAQGAFSHPIVAGVYWSTVLLFLVAQLSAVRRYSPALIIGIVSSAVIVVCCASSTPVFMLAAGILGCTLWVVRSKIRLIVWGSLAALVGLHFIMEAPVWHLLARVSAVGGSTGWHRYHLIDEFVGRVPEWLVAGVASTAHWGWGLQDVTNQFVLEGVRAGILGLSLFSLVLAVAFRHPAASNELEDVIFSWCVKGILFAHCAAFFSVSYFGQAWIMFWFTLSLLQARSCSSIGTHKVSKVSSGSRLLRFDYV